MNSFPPTKVRARRAAAAAIVVAVLITGLIHSGVTQPALAEEAGPAAAGPALLNAPEPRAPQLENTGIWQADSTRICHTSAYRAGEYVHQGCVYDDQGAQLVPTHWPEHSLVFAYRYPTNPIYRQNAADLVEVRVKPLADATAFRITYNTMLDPSLVGTTIALGTSDQARPAPHGANTKLPAKTFVTVHGTTGDIVDAATGKTLSEQPTVTVDLERRQLEVRVPHSAFDPGDGKARVAAATGLWDNEHDRFLLPRPVADHDHPGGLLNNVLHPSAYFDVAFRFDEPFDSSWRNDQQKKALVAGDISKFYADVDFAKLAAGAEDDMADKREGIPTSGYLERIYPTSSELRQGRRLPGDPGKPPLGAFTQQNGAETVTDTSGEISVQFGWICRDDCVPDLPGQLQRYVAYVPETDAPAGGYGTVLWTPGYAQTANDQVNDSGTAGTSKIINDLLSNQEKDFFQLMANNSKAPSVVISVDGRGNDNWYYGSSGASVFEALRDARAVFDLDESRTVMSGFSSGAYGANKLSLQFPDVFSKAFICDGLNKAPSFPLINGIADTLPIDTVTKHEPGSELTPLLPSRRNQPVLEWAGLPDNYIPTNIPTERLLKYVADPSYDFNFTIWTALSSDHVIMCANGTWKQATDWLGDLRGPADIFHVTYVRNPFWDDPKSGLIGDHAYWLSGIETRDHELGTIDVKSHGYGLAAGQSAPIKERIGTASGTTVPINAYASTIRDKSDPVAAPVADELDIIAENIGSVTIDPKQAKISCNAKLNVKTDGPLTVKIIGCGSRTFG